MWRDSDNGKAFRTALAQRGYVLCRGDRRDFVLVDAAGHEHSLARRLDGVKAVEIRKRLRDLDSETLPMVTHGREKRRADKEKVSAAVSRGADRKRVQAAINSGRASGVSPHGAHEDMPEREARESYENTARRRRGERRVDQWQDRAKQREKDAGRER